MVSEEKYLRRKAAQEGRYRNQYAERWFGWWRHPPDRFAFLLVAFTAGLFAATLMLYIATRDLVHEAEKTAERQLRAYVFVDSTTLQEQGGVVRVELVIKNFGQTPAYGLSYWSAMGVRAFPLANSEYALAR